MLPYVCVHTHDSPARSPQGVDGGQDSVAIESKVNEAWLSIG